MKLVLTVTVDKTLLEEIEKLRGREKRSSFVNYLLWLGLERYKENPD